MGDALAHRREAHLARPHAESSSAARALADRETAAGTTYDLNDRREVGMLISRSPQLDGDDDTMRDRDRCGGAAVVNGMLLSGNPAANADALRTVAGPSLVAASPGADEALTHFHDGRMTAHDTQVLQELAYEAGRARNADAERPAVGLSRSELTPLMRELRAAGAFPDSRVELSNHAMTAGGSHWTVAVDGPNGPGSADSWPRDDGYATVMSGTDLSVPGTTRRDSHVTLDRGNSISSGPG